MDSRSSDLASGLPFADQVPEIVQSMGRRAPTDVELLDSDTERAARSRLFDEVLAG